MTITTRTSKGAQLTWAEMDGNLTDLDSRTAEVWQNLRGHMDTEGIPNSPPMELFNSTMYMHAFSSSVEQEVSCIFHMPKDYKIGTDTYPHGHVTVTTASSGVVRWKITMSYAGEGAVFSSPYTFYVEEDVLTTDTNKCLLMEAGAMVIPDLTTDAIILFRIARDATHINDTYPDAAYLMQVDLYYRSQGFGEVTR